MNPAPSAGATPDQSPAAGIRSRDVLGIPIAVTDYDGALGVMERLIERRERGWVCVAAVMSVVVAQDDPGMRQALTEATITVPDGMPLVWAANALGENLHGRVYGPELMDRHCRLAAQRGWRVWLYGGRDEQALEQLSDSLRRRHPGLQVVGGYSPPHRELTDEETRTLAARIDADRPDVLWVGVGVPKQERWMVRMRPLLEVPVMCGVGAAFDFHAGRVSQAPSWMQDRGLEWAYRISREPRRLLGRYLRTNPRFVYGFARQYLRERRDAPKSG